MARNREKHICNSCGQAFPPLSPDEQLAEKLRRIFYCTQHPNGAGNLTIWHEVLRNERKAWLAVVQAARKDLIDVQGPITKD